MNTPSNVMSDLPLESRAVAPVSVPIIQQLYWSVRREIWDNRSIYIAPSAAAGLFLLAFGIGLMHLRRLGDGSAGFEYTQHNGTIQQAYNFAAALIMGITFLVAFFYCLDAMYGERRDRSILFWKSLPVSDLTTVLSKLMIPMVVLPAVTVAVTLVTQILMWILQSILLMGSGLSAGSHAPSLEAVVMLIYHLVTVHVLWYAPIYAWLFLISSWVRRAPLLWAVVPPFIIGILEKVAFNTAYFTQLLKSRIAGGSEGASFVGPGMNMEGMAHLAPLHFLASSGLWGGLVFAAICLAAAVQIRRLRGPL